MAPDPEVRTLRAIAGSKALKGEWGEHPYPDMPTSGLPLYAAWGFSEVGVFVDYAALYQRPRDEAQERGGELPGRAHSAAHPRAGRVPAVRGPSNGSPQEKNAMW